MSATVATSSRSSRHQVLQYNTGKFCPISYSEEFIRKCLIVSSNILNMFVLVIVLMRVIMEHETLVMKRLLPLLILMTDCSLQVSRLCHISDVN